MGKLTDVINRNNALGRSNLAKKGVELSENATTYEIMQSISKIVVNDDGEKTYVEVIPTATITLAQKNEEWIEGITTFFELLQEINTVQDYRLTIDEKVIDCSFSKISTGSEYEQYGCGNVGLFEDNDNGEDYLFAIRPNAIYLLLRNEDAGQHTIKLEVVYGGSSEDDNGGIEYTSIVYNDDDTITLTDIEGNEHTIVCEYDGDKLVSATYDDKAVELAYDGDSLVGIGGTDVDLSNAPMSKNYPPTWFTFEANVEPIGSVERID